MSLIEKEMPFLEHLEELRWHLIRSVAAIAVFSIAAFFAKDFVVGQLILGPSKTNFLTYRLFCQLSQLTCIDKLPFVIQSRTMTGQFTMHMAASLTVGLIASFPYIFWEIWRFVKPALYLTEKQVTRGVTALVSLLFMIGILFGYYLIAPLSINFLANYQLDPSIVNEFDITSYVSTLVMMVLSSGIMFQLPMVVYFLSKIGILHPSFMRSYRRQAIVIILFVSAIITPPDVVSQMLIASPIYFLYEISINISASVWKKHEKALAKIEAK